MSNLPDKQPNPDSSEPECDALWKLLHGQLPLEKETVFFILASALDVFMTYLVLRYSADGKLQADIVESNPVAAWFFNRWGMKGMVYFKFAVVALVCVIAQVVYRKRPVTASVLLKGATMLVAGVVIYSFFLFLRASGHV